MAYFSINIDQEFLEDSFSNNDEMGRKTIMPKNLNIKHGIARYKLKLEEKKKNEKQLKVIGKHQIEKSKTLNSPNFWQSDTDNAGEKKLNQGNYIINIQNMKLPGEKFKKNINSTNTFNNPSAYNENTVYRTSSIKGNLFRNTSRTMRFQMADPFVNEKKTIKFKNFNEKRTTQDNFYKENHNNNNEYDINTHTNNVDNKVNEYDVDLSPNKNENLNNIKNEKDSNTSMERNHILNIEREYLNNNLENLPISSKTQFNFFNKKTLMENRRLIASRDNIMTAKSIYNPKSLVEFNHQPVRTPSTIYNVLNKRKKEFFENIKTQNIKNSTLEPSNDLLHQKKKFLKTNNITSLLEQKKKDFIPYVFPTAWIHPNSYGNISEKNRFEKITDLFLKLRVYFHENPENELVMAKEFFIRHGIYDKEFFTIDKLSNFIVFIKSDDCLKINPSRALKEIIMDSCHINTFENPNSSNYENHVYPGNLNNFINENINNNPENFQIPNILSSSHQNGNNFMNVPENSNNNPINNSILKTCNNMNTSVAVNQPKNNSTNQANIQTDNNNYDNYDYNNNNINLNFNSNHRFQGNNKIIHNDLISKAKPSTSQSVKIRNIHFNNFEKGGNLQFNPEERTNASMHPILNEKIYKIEYHNPKAIIENLEPEIAKIKGLSINDSAKKVETKSYERGINNMKKSKKILNEEIRSTTGQLPMKDIEQIKKKSKLLEYIVLQRSKNRLKLENDKKVFELEYNAGNQNENDPDDGHKIKKNMKYNNSIKKNTCLIKPKKTNEADRLKHSVFPKVIGNKEKGYN